MKQVAQDHRVLHVIVGAGNAGYFLNCIRSVVNLCAGDIFAAYNYVSPSDKTAIEAKRHAIGGSVSKLIVNKNEPTRRTGSLYAANNLGLEFARQGYDFANFIQADMQMMWWNEDLLKTARDIAQLSTPLYGSSISFFTQIPVRGKKKNVYDGWEWDESANTFRTTGFSDVCLVPLFDGLNEDLSFDGDEESMSQAFSQHGSALFYHPHPFIAPIPFPSNVRDPQKSPIEAASGAWTEILRINPNFSVALDAPTLHPLSMEDAVFPNGWACSNPYWPSDTTSSTWLRRRFHTLRADPLSLFEIRKANGLLSRWPLRSSSPGLVRTISSLSKLIAEETKRYLLRWCRTQSTTVRKQIVRKAQPVLEALPRQLSRIAIDRLIPGFPVFREISFDTYSLTETAEEILPASPLLKTTKAVAGNSSSPSDSFPEKYPAIRACVMADAIVFYNRRFSPLLVGQNCMVPQRNEPAPWDFGITSTNKDPGTTMFQKGTTIGFRGGFSKRKLAHALYIGTRAPDNYYHWLVNALPSLHLLNDSTLIPPGTPVLVPDIVQSQKQLVDALEVVAGTTPIEYFGTTESIQVQRLFFADPPPVYDTPLSLHRKDRQPLSFHRDAMSSYRDHIYTVTNARPRNNGEERLFLLRSGEDPRSANQEELLRIAEDFGFRGVHTELMTFTEQVQLFSEAKFLTGPSGAAFTNMLFSYRAKALIYKDHSDENENFFSLLASLGEGQVFSMSARVDEGEGLNFISPSRYRKALEKLLSGKKAA